MDKSVNSNLLKIAPLKSDKEKELFKKWRHVLRQKKVNKQTVAAYNADLQALLQSQKSNQ